MTAPDFPAGPLQPAEAFDPQLKLRRVELLARAPDRLREALHGLDSTQLDTPYRNWSIRQITHHLADSHVHSYIRFKWALTEDNPTIKGYEEADWVQLSDSRTGDVSPALALLEGLHSKWVQLLTCMSDEDFSRTFHHPQFDEVVDLWTALNYYPWHSMHHTGQILWLRETHGW